MSVVKSVNRAGRAAPWTSIERRIFNAIPYAANGRSSFQHSSVTLGRRQQQSARRLPHCISQHSAFLFNSSGHISRHHPFEIGIMYMSSSIYALSRPCFLSAYERLYTEIVLPVGLNNVVEGCYVRYCQISFA